MCYDDSDKLYAHVFKTGDRLLKDAMGSLGFNKSGVVEQARPSSDTSVRSEPSRLIGLNTLPWSRPELNRIPDSGLETYCLYNGEGILNVRPLLSPYPAISACIKETRQGVYELSNSQYKVEVSNGVITSLYDLAAKREVIAKGKKANQLVIFDDKPLYWQAWDVEVYHLDSRTELHAGKTSITESGPHRVSVEVETKISERSWIKTTISLAAAIGDTPSYVEMSSEVEWRETMKFLKVEFPVDIVNQEASYETQFGIVRRPTHYNTTWDMAKFEVCCHKWADLSEAGYGVSILNDSKYGFATCGDLMRLSLLRAPKAPDAHADMGRHHIRYAILPHRGPLSPTTIRTARAFNSPLRVGTHSNPSSISPLLNSLRVTGADNLVLDTIKRGEDDVDMPSVGIPLRKDRSIIIRIYDAMGGRSTGTLSWGVLNVVRVEKCNVLEDEGEEVGIVETEVEVVGTEARKSKGVEIEIRAFEVATFRLVLGD